MRWFHCLMARQFLTARLLQIVHVNYRVPADLLLPYVPRGTELDAPPAEPDLHFVSLVALRLAGARFYGLPLPTARDFPQLNLRFYVRRGPLHGVVFLREYVATPLVALGGRLLYQPFELTSLSHRIEAHDGVRNARTAIEHRTHRGEISIRARDEPVLPAASSEDAFVKERHWGFYRTRSGATYGYRLTHPEWHIYPIESVEITVDPGLLLGPEWQAVEWKSALHSVIFADGSPSAVYEPERQEGGAATD